MTRRIDHLAIERSAFAQALSTFFAYSLGLVVTAATVGGVVKLFSGRRNQRYVSADVKGEIMPSQTGSAGGAPKETNGGNGNGSPLLRTILQEKETVETTTEDFLEKAREMGAEEYSRAFDKKVGGHGGFSASLRGSSK